MITALIMGIASGSRKETLSNEEIKERAKALGMVEESTLLADVEKITPSMEPLPDGTPESVPTREPEAAPTPSPEAASASTPMPTSTPETTPAPTPSPEAVSTPTPEPVSAPAPTPEPSPQEEQGESNAAASTVTIQVNRGDGSFTVSRKLEEAGLVSSAAEFDLYLCQNGYDKRLNVGSFEIPAGADEEQIAKILSGRQ